MAGEGESASSHAARRSDPSLPLRPLPSHAPEPSDPSSTLSASLPPVPRSLLHPLPCLPAHIVSLASPPTLSEDIELPAVSYQSLPHPHSLFRSPNLAPARSSSTPSPASSVPSLTPLGPGDQGSSFASNYEGVNASSVPKTPHGASSEDLCERRRWRQSLKVSTDCAQGGDGSDHFKQRQRRPSISTSINDEDLAASPTTRSASHKNGSEKTRSHSIFTRRSTLVESFRDSKELACIPSLELPAEWKEEFRESLYRPTMLRICSLIATPTFLFMFLYSNFSDDSIPGSRTLHTLTYLPFLVSCIFCAFTSFLILFEPAKKLCINYYSVLVIFFSLSLYSSFIVPDAVKEYRRTLYGDDRAEYVTWRIDYSTFPPTRNCTDSNPSQTMRFWHDFHAIGCNNMVLGGDNFCLYVTVLLDPLVFHLNHKEVIVQTVLMTILLLVGSLATGSHHVLLMTLTLFQFLVGMSIAVICRSQRKSETEQFVIAKYTKVSSDQSRSIVHTLVPPDVATKLAFHDRKNFLGTTIPSCTIMFCSLEPRALLKAAPTFEIFRLMDDVFKAFDNIVSFSGMYKYQHVGDWYIITCPRAANPFAEQEHKKPYPQEYVSTMIQLASSLQQTCKEYDYRGTQLSLKVGLHFGSAAGAVIGVHRSFYCVYGDTINTAARMCKYAEEDEIACSRQLADKVLEGDMGEVECSSKGSLFIKGKGEMEVFRLRVKENVVVTPYVFNDEQRSRLSSMGSDSSIVEPLLRVRLDELSKEGRVLIKSSKFALNRLGTEFMDAKTEKYFLQDCTYNHRMIMSAGVLVHALAVLCQWHSVNFPESNYSLERQSGDLHKDTVFVILTVHMGVVVVLSVLAIICFLRADYMGWKQRTHIALLKITFSACSLAANFYIAMDGWLILFSTVFVAIHSMASGIAFKHNVLVCTTAFFLSVPYIASERAKSERIEIIVEIILTVLVSIAVSRIVDKSERLRWRLYKLFQVEFRRLRLILVDLLPDDIAEKMIHDKMSFDVVSRRAVVLQLDICNFTSMSQTMSALDVATMVHTVFSSFDSSVERLGLFKMDTIGDAYIVAGWLPDSPEWHEDKKSRKICRNMLTLARDMITAMEEYRQSSGQEVNCRIGISVGKFACGLIGRVQSRFHVMGRAMGEVEHLEQRSVINGIHVSDKFLRGLGFAGVHGCGRRESEARVEEVTMEVTMEGEQVEEEACKEGENPSETSSSSLHDRVAGCMPLNWKLVRSFTYGESSEEKEGVKEESSFRPTCSDESGLHVEDETMRASFVFELED